jgi:hypothetical protein
MRKELPVYEIMIDLDDPETTVSFNSMVEFPAHEKNFDMYSKKNVKYQFNEEQQIVTGIAISADTPIYRYDEKSKEEYYVVFTKDAIRDIVFDYARRNNFNNVNLDHNPHKVVDGVFMVMSYQIDNDRGFTAPERFKDANDGSWLTSYKITDKALWEKAKNGEFNGFSIEGVFNLIETDNTLESDFEAILKEVELWRRNTERIRMFNDYPEAVSNNAKRGLELNEKNGNKCATRVGRLRATTLANRDTVSLEIIKRMYSYLSRAEVYYNESDTSACGTISFLMWGGKAGLRWTEAKLKELGEM